MKPIELVEIGIRNSSGQGEIVLDLFGGSGSTLIACEKNARRALLMELDPKYVDVIVERWQAYAGKTARTEDGRTFEEVKAARAAA
jgi:DNA modification methylase